MSRKLLVTALPVLVCGGCIGLKSPNFFSGGSARVDKVEISNLDWVEISYLPHPSDPYFKAPCRLSLFGAGEIEFRSGRSPRVADSFSSAVDDPYWDDLYIDRFHIGQEEMERYYQEFVDAGVFVRRRSGGPDADTLPLVRVNAQVGRRRNLCITDERRVVSVVEEILDIFTGASASVYRRRQ